MKSSEALPVKQEVEAFSLKEDGEMNASELQSYYADMPELQFHQLMQDMDFFAQEFSDPVFGFADTFDTLIRDYSGDPELEIHARTSIQSAENLIESEWLYNIRVGESDCSSDSGQITPEDYDSEASSSEYYSCEEEDGSNQVLGKFNEVENVLNLLHEVAQSPTVQSFADFVPECVVPFYEPDIVKGTVLFDEGVAINGDQNVENSELCKETNPSFDTEETHSIDLSSTSLIETYDKPILDSGYEDNAFWSILTDTVVYHGENNLSSLKFDIDNLYTTVNQTYITDPKDLYFSADNNNIPNLITHCETGKGEPGGHGPGPQFLNSQGDNTKRQNFKSKQEYFMAAHCNEPELNQRYPVKTTVRDKFDPVQCVTTTYLWSNRSANPPPRFENKGMFDMGKISFKIDSTLQGKLLDENQTKVDILIDTGATRAIVNKAFYDNTPSMQTAPVFKLETPSLIRTPSQVNPYMFVEECVLLLVEIQGHVFKIYAYILPQMDTSYDLILGQKPLYELEGGPNFGTLTLTFMARSLELYNSKEIRIPPGKMKRVFLDIVNCPKEFKNGKAICNLLTNGKGKRVQTMYLAVKNKKVQLEMDNNTPADWVIPLGSLCGSIDMRSVGYFMIQREDLYNLLTTSDTANFLTEDETMQYYRMVVQEVYDATTDRNYENTKLSQRYNQEEEKINQPDGSDLYPWLDDDDPRRKMTDEEILEKYVDLTDSDLTKAQKAELVKIMIKYKKAFSLRDEIGTCPKIEVELELNDKRPFFIRPYSCTEEDKDVIDKQMKKGCLLGILKKGMTSYSSPIMLIPRKQGGIPRIVTDFRHLNSRLVVLQPSIPLIRDAIQIIGASGCEVISLIDLRDAYHTLPLSPKSKKYCGITPYYGSSTYIYQRLGIGLSVSPAIWQNFIQTVLEEIPNYRKHYLAIMDDIMIHSKHNDHMSLVIKLFKALIGMV